MLSILAALLLVQVAGEAPPTQPTAPVTHANNRVRAQTTARDAAVDELNMSRDARYAADMAAYLDARHIAAADRMRYDRQQRAYADAMAAWRDQVRACRRGYQRACEAPTPDPAAFY